VEEIDGLVSAWAGEAVRSVVRLSGGRANESYRVRLADGREVVFRWYEPRFSPSRTVDSIEYEHAVLGRLDALGLPVPLPLASRGETVGQTGGRFYAVLSYLAGEPFALGDAGLIEQAALVLARIHGATAAVRDLGQRPGFGRYLDFDWVAPERSAVAWFTALRGHTYDGESLPWEALAATLRATLAELRRAGYAEHPTVLVHTDMNEHNQLQVDGTLTGILDFDYCHLDSPALDLAAAVWQLCRIPPDFAAFDWDAVRRLVRRYQQRYPIPVECYDALVAGIRAWMLVGYLWCARSVLASGNARDARSLASSTRPSRLGLLERDGAELIRVAREAAAGV